MRVVVYITLVTALLCKIQHIFGAGPIAGIFDPNCFVVDGDCPNENVTFWLYTNETANNPIQLDPLNPQQSDFPLPRSVKILIHGYTGHRDFAPNTYIRPALLQSEDVYVISPDYGPLVREPCYVAAVQNLPLVSRCLAQLINNLVAENIVASEDIHIIGFSLGAQVAGQTANYLTEKLTHITGLDPAKPLFITVGDDRRLSKDDADFVDVIHTDVWGRGMLQTLGHVDFYPNFGPVQPGCELEAETGSCNHDRAPRFYAESINLENKFWASSCPHWVFYVLNFCDLTKNDALMGYYVDHSLTGTYFLRTANSTPFALGRIDTTQQQTTSIEAPNWLLNIDLNVQNEEECAEQSMCQILSMKRKVRVK